MADRLRKWIVLSTWGRKWSNGGGCENDIVDRMNYRYKAWEALKIALSNKGLGVNAKIVCVKE